VRRLLNQLTVWLVTVANRGDNIGIYVPLFASSNWRELVVLVGVFDARRGSGSSVTLSCYCAPPELQH